jgi:hypothetical protein
MGTVLDGRSVKGGGRFVKGVVDGKEVVAIDKRRLLCNRNYLFIMIKIFKCK